MKRAGARRGFVRAGLVAFPMVVLGAIATPPAQASGTYGSCGGVTNMRWCAWKDANEQPSNLVFIGSESQINDFTAYKYDSVHSWNDAVSDVYNVPYPGNPIETFYIDKGFGSPHLDVNPNQEIRDLTTVRYDSVHSFNDAFSSYTSTVA